MSLYLSSLKYVIACWKSHIFVFSDDLCDLSNEDHIHLAYVVICVIICVIWFFRICLLFGLFKNLCEWCLKITQIYGPKKSCDSWSQITHVIGPLRSHGWWVDRAIKNITYIVNEKPFYYTLFKMTLALLEKSLYHNSYNPNRFSHNHNHVQRALNVGHRDTTWTKLINTWISKMWIDITNHRSLQHH
jgi:hypothetical protein